MNFLKGLFKARIENNKVEVKYVHTINGWEFPKDEKEEENFINNIKWSVVYEMEKQIVEEAVASLKKDNSKLVEGLVKELLESFDYKKPILDAMQTQCKQYLLRNDQDNQGSMRRP